MARGEVRSPTDRRLRDRTPEPCANVVDGTVPEGCEGTFMVLPSRKGKTRRCPACIEARRYRCSHCSEVFVDNEREGRGSKPSCDKCWEERSTRPVAKPRSERIRYDCRGIIIGRGEAQHATNCDGWKELTAADVRSRLRTGSTSLDEKARTCICKPCKSLKQVVVIARSWCQKAMAGTPGLPDELVDELANTRFLSRQPTTLAEAKQVNAIVGRYIKDTLKPPAAIDGKARVAKRMAKGQQRANRAARGLRSTATNDRRGDHIVAGKWRKGVRIRVSPCLWPECGRLVFSEKALNREPEMHRACMTAAMRSAEGRAWLSERKIDRDQGLAPHVVNRLHGSHLPIPGRPDETLEQRSEPPTRWLTWAVRNLLGEESMSALGEEAGVSRPAVSKGIERVLGLLPPDELVPKYYRQLVGRLRLADQRRRRD